MIISYDSSNDKKYPVAPEGLHPAVAVDVVDLGMKDTKFGQKHKLRIIWQLEELDPETGRRLTASQMYTASMHPESGLSKTLESWRGRKFTDDERRKFDPEVLVGQCCQIQVTHAPGSEGKVYANVSAVVPLGKGMIALRAVDYVRVQDRPAKDGNAAPQQKAYDDSVPF